jgi:CRISPR-associated protein Csd1
VLGRLFAVLEAIQMDANPGIKATIQRSLFQFGMCDAGVYFSGILIKLKNSHMKKLEREKGSSKIYYEQQLTKMAGQVREVSKAS